MTWLGHAFLAGQFLSVLSFLVVWYHNPVLTFRSNLQQVTDRGRISGSGEYGLRSSLREV